MRFLPLNIRSISGPFRARAPLLFAQHVWLIFLMGAVASLALGIVVFYFEAYAPLQRSYEATLPTTEVDKAAVERVLEFITEEKSSHGSLPSENPFAP